MKWRGLWLLWQAIAMLCCLAGLAGCGGKREGYPAKSVGSVEISPGKWLELRASNAGGLAYSMEWDGREVRLPVRGAGGSADDLVYCIRASDDGDLFAIKLARPRHSTHLVFLRADPQAGVFEEIVPGEFPKRIATQNWELDDLWSVRDKYGKPIDGLTALRKLDVESHGFRISITRHIWAVLETGETYDVVKQWSNEELIGVAREYVGKYDPIPLPDLVRPGK